MRGPLAVTVNLPDHEAHTYGAADAVTATIDKFGTRVEITPAGVRLWPAPHVRVEFVSVGSRDDGYPPLRSFDIRLSVETEPAS